MEPMQHHEEPEQSETEETEEAEEAEEAEEIPGLGERVSALRRAVGLSQRRLAELSGVSHGYIGLLERGRLSSPGKFRLDAIAHHLGLAGSDALTPLATTDGDTSDAGGTSGARGSLRTRGPGSRGRRTQPRRERHSGPGVAAPDLPRPGPVRPDTSGASGGGSQAMDNLGSPTRRSQAGGGSRSQARVAGLAGPELASPDSASFAPEGWASNVVGMLDQLVGAGSRLLPVFRWGSCGDPRDRESPPDPDHLENPPLGRETLIGPNGFGVMVKGESMAGRGIHDGDTVWVNPDRPYALGKVVLALVRDAGGVSGMVVKTYARTDVGECLLSETEAGRSPVVCQEFRVIGPVVGITAWRLPS
jgi:SOS-response transcriptional repressor LexA/DNA-binding transcriptional regulator YiaG